MEKVSAMKKVALFLMIVGLAVAMVACQGAVGPKGDKGDDGADGVAGTDGTAGTDAFQPLSLKATSPSVVITDGTDPDDATEAVAGGAQTIDLADYIRGTADRKYGTPANSQETVAEQIFVAKLEGSMLTITPKVPQPEDNIAYRVETFMVMISDGGESTAIPLEIPARRNRKPVTPQTDGMGTVGTQAPAMAPDSVPACPAANECYVDVIFTDPDGADPNAAEEKLSFTATSGDTSKVEVVSYDNAVTDGETQPLVARVVVKGVASTFDADADPTTGMVEVTIVATDEGGATVRGTANITVDGAPTADPLPDGTVSQGATTNTYTFDASGFFEDPEEESLTITAEMTEATAKFASVAVSGSDVTVTRKAPGSAVVTVTAMEQGSAPQQSVKGTFTVTVN